MGDFVSKSFYIELECVAAGDGICAFEVKPRI
jgi:predicted hydrocarbon binding protein